MRKYLDFDKLEEVEKQNYIEDTWCEKCQKADLGIDDLEMFIEDNIKFVSGKCKVCGSICTSEIIEK